MKHFLRFAVALLAALWCSTPLFAQRAERRETPWTQAVLDAAERTPIQEGGRVKPLNTYAGFLLLRLNGKRSLATPQGETLAPSAWLLDLLFFPEQAAEYECFLVQDAQVIEAIGLHLDGKRKRDRYSYRELQPGLGKLYALAQQFQHIDEKQREPLQQQVVALAHNIDEYEAVAHHADFARAELSTGGSERLRKLFDDRASVSVRDLAAQAAELAELDRALAADSASPEDRQAAAALFHGLDDLLGSARTLALYPPARTAPRDTAWLSPSDVVAEAFAQRGVEAQLELMGWFERAARSCADPEAFSAAFEGFSARAVAQAQARDEFGSVDLEVSYYRADLLGKALAAFLFAFVLAGGMWLAPRVKLLYAGAGVVALVGLGCLASAIVVRCVIRDRPPVSTLYETLLFVTGVGVLAALVMEWINRQRLALSAAVVLGALGLFLSGRYEELDKRDTMPQLVAVLDTNFWLATHVTAITIGYSAGLLAALLANANLIAGFFAAASTSRATALAPLRKSLARMTYGALCFGLIFSVVGTILGGIWANESWGRFWGWDPKENGALLICLAQLVILHARQGGYLRDFGIAMATAFQGTVIAFSWFGVNLLGVGLHSYGFTSGIHTALWSYYLAQWGLIGVAGAHYLWITRPESAPAAQRATSASTASAALRPERSAPSIEASSR
ncbi:MAG: cytochrome c biogenesis protein CcsA [Planctomycetes bacterium]|nr:cytochrome c biogenesis protein CcsA [Planctomycetota bacterium]